MPMVAAVTGLRCRQIDEADIDAVANSARARISGARSSVLAGCVCATHPARAAAGPAEIWLSAGDRRRRRRRDPADLLDRTGDGASTTRCNLSSWYVEPAFRAYAPMLVSQALRHKDVTYLNVSPAPHTRPIIEAQGFSRYSDGIFVAVAAAERTVRRPEGRSVRGGPRAGRRVRSAGTRDAARSMPRTAASSLWCATSERAFPFVFRPRMVQGVVPCAQLIYCSDVADFVRFAGPLGRALARRGRPFVVLDANGRHTRTCSVFSAPATCRNISRVRSVRASAISLTPSRRCWACSRTQATAASANGETGPACV